MSDNQTISRRQWLKTIAAAAGGVLVARLSGSLTADAAGTTAATAAAGTLPPPPQTTTVSRIGKIAEGKAVGCVECDSCMPCGYGVDIPGNFRVYNTLLAEGSVPDIEKEDPESRQFATKARKFLRTYDREIPDAHQSQRCIKCFHCANECSEHIFIVNELASLTYLADTLRDWECTH